MTLISAVFIFLMLVMYLEGMLFTSALLLLSGPQSKLAKIFFLILWPVMTMALMYKVYKTYMPLVEQVRNNPLLGALMSNQIQNEVAETSIEQ